MSLSRQMLLTCAAVGERRLQAFLEPLIRRSAWKGDSPKFGFTIVNILPYQTGAERH
jgi:hypothetical protein